jgi:predicted transcriptional regulator
MPRPPASSFRLDDDTDARLARLTARLELNRTEVIRQAVRHFHDLQFGGGKVSEKNKKKPRTGIANGDTSH